VIIRHFCSVFYTFADFWLKYFCNIRDGLNDLICDLLIDVVYFLIVCFQKETIKSFAGSLFAVDLI